MPTCHGAPSARPRPLKQLAPGCLHPACQGMMPRAPAMGLMYRPIRMTTWSALKTSIPSSSLVFQVH
jgi:hypothetical protein